MTCWNVSKRRAVSLTVSSLCSVLRPQETEAAPEASEVATGEAVSQTEATPSSTQEAEDEEDGAAEVNEMNLFFDI